ncbi:glutamate--tRNA ligase [Hydrogenophilus thermoluteolus]|uniref:glutamate--tRNA ligase n=1 Tax=Hydrogenophilus thermoluteolus TaxID=297 RepID=UPI0024A20B46|nr:glutamate--tRNA ligase [Hydrogenophilus thermoluteolus]GLW60160.1 glutamate--tRNA ligase [Hydrogenophilus thermoluteolus]
MSVRTRFAPSPTGYLHLGGARTALFNWAYARHHKGQFILRIEDTDRERSTPEAVQAILDGIHWLGLDYDEGPFYQTQRMDRYREVIQRLLNEGKAYYCYATPEELDAMREAQRAQGLKPKYDGRWRPEPGKVLPPPPDGVPPVVRFKAPTSGKVGWHDLVKGWIEFDNSELDDFVIARADGTPTYNFCVVVDDWDMAITHVIRGDDHVNNTPRQIHLYHALGATLPHFAHLSMILGPDGQKLSKRHGAVSVMQYHADGYLPEAMVNYLARLGWSHGDDELFSREQLIAWFDLDHITPSAARFDFDKLRWVNAHYIKASPIARLASEVAERLARRGVDPEQGPELEAVVALYRDRADTLEVLTDSVLPFYQPVHLPAELVAAHVDDSARTVLRDFRERLATLSETDWTPETIAAAMKATLAACGVKMPKLGIPLRVVLLGTKQSPAIDQVVAVLGKRETLARLDRLV